MPVEMLVFCLRRYGEHRAAKFAAPSAVPQESLADVLSAGAILNRTEAASLASALSDPIRSTLRLTVRDIGWRIFTNGGIKEMERVAELVVEAMPDQPTLALSTLDKWWDGIGSAKNQWLS